MAINPKANLTRINQITSAWGTLRPEKKFAGLTLDQFREEIAPCLAARATIARLENELIAARIQRDDNDRAARQTIQRVVNSVKGDVQERRSDELYTAMGYCTLSKRKSGLTRKTKATETTTKA